MDWRHRSNCLDEDPELFFPVGLSESSESQAEEARRICRRCEVRDQCLAWALDAAVDHGVLGGLSESERRLLRRARQR